MRLKVLILVFVYLLKFLFDMLLMFVIIRFVGSMVWMVLILFGLRMEVGKNLRFVVLVCVVVSVFVVVKMLGSVIMLRLIVCVSIGILILGLMKRCLLVFSNWLILLMVSMVLVLISVVDGVWCVVILIDLNGLGEFRGILIVLKFLLSNMLIMFCVFLGFRLCRMVMRGYLIGGNGMGMGICFYFLEIVERELGLDLICGCC